MKLHCGVASSERETIFDIREILKVTGGTVVEETDRPTVTPKSWRNYLEGKDGVVFQNWQPVTDGGETTKMMMGRARPRRGVHRSRP